MTYIPKTHCRKLQFPVTTTFSDSQNGAQPFHTKPSQPHSPPNPKAKVGQIEVDGTHTSFTDNIIIMSCSIACKHVCIFGLAYKVCGKTSCEYKYQHHFYFYL